MSVAADARAFIAAARMYLRQQRRYPTYFIGLLFWPVMLPAFWVLMGRAYSGDDPQAMAEFASRAGTTNVAGFLFVGFAMYMWLSALLWGPGTALRQEQVRGSLEAVFLTPASRLVPLFGPGVALLIPLFGTAAVMETALWLLFGIVPPLGAVLPALVTLVLGMPSLYAIGALFSAAVLRFGEPGPIVQLVRGIFVLTCGVMFPVAMLPLWAQLTAAFLPPTYIVSDIRRLLLQGGSLSDVLPDAVLVLAFAVITAALSIVVFRILEASARRSGILGQF